MTNFLSCAYTVVQAGGVVTSTGGCRSVGTNDDGANHSAVGDRGLCLVSVVFFSHVRVAVATLNTRPSPAGYTNNTSSHTRQTACYLGICGDMLPSTTPRLRLAHCCVITGKVMCLLSPAARPCTRPCARPRPRPCTRPCAAGHQRHVSRTRARVPGRVERGSGQATVSQVYLLPECVTSLLPRC